MNYKETLDYLYSCLPMFHRVGAAAYKADLNTTIFLSKRLGNPELKFPSVHIAGTNGKGSVSAMLSAILQSAGYKTGLFTSPHLKDFRERIRINGEMISEQKVIDFVKNNRLLFDEVQPSFFEWTAALAFHHFAEEKLEIAVMETGMGGRLDSTNIVKSILSIITNIGWDHQQFLGDTLEKIAGEKAGIIKAQVPVVIGESREETFRVFQDRAEDLKAPLVFADNLFRSEIVSLEADRQVLNIYRQGELFMEALSLDLTGAYQQKNILTVLQAVLKLREQGYALSDLHIREGLENVRQLSGIRGRWEVIGQNPLTICDVGHNEAGIREVLNQLKLTPHRGLHMVLGFMKDKDISQLLEILPQDPAYYFCAADLPRALPAEELKKQAAFYGLKGAVFPGVAEAIQAARKQAKEGDLVFVGGSTFVVAEAV